MHTYIQPSQSGGRVYEIKTLRSNLAPEEGGGRLFEGAYNRVSTVLMHGAYTPSPKNGCLLAVSSEFSPACYIITACTLNKAIMEASTHTWEILNFSPQEGGGGEHI